MDEKFFEKIKEDYSLNSGNAAMENENREWLLAEADVERLRAVLQNIAEELEGEEPRTHKKIALSIREALKS